MKGQITGLDNLEKELRQRLRETDDTLREISEVTGISASRLGDFKNEKFDFPIRKLNKLANYFQVRYRIENWKE